MPPTDALSHPDPALRGQDARALRDPDGKAFGADMLNGATGRRGDGSRLPVSAQGTTIPVPKTSFVTRVKDMVCGVGYNG